MEKEKIDKLLEKREILLEKLSMYNNTSMFDCRNYEPHKKRARKSLHKIADILYKELNIDEKFNAL